MASNKVSKQVRTAWMNARPAGTMLAVALFTLAGTAVALGQGTAPAKPANDTPAAPSGPTPPSAAVPTAPSNPPADAAPAKNGVQAKLDNKAADGTDKVHVDGNQIVDLHVNDEDLANVLEMLSIQSQKNIVASKSVNARVTANLYGVTFKEALDAILNVNGFGYIEDGNFIYVYTTKEIEEIQKQQRQRVSQVIQLNYLNAVDAAEFVKPLLSDGAQIKTNGKIGNFPSPGEVPLGNEEYAGGSTLVVTDYEDHIGEIVNLIKQLDTKPSQVLVESTIMQTTLTEDNAFGVDFSIIADMDFGDFVQLGGPLSATNTLINGASDPNRQNPFPADGKGGSVSSTVGNTAGPGGLKAGIVKGDVSVFLRVLDEVTDTTILSNPKILALNRQPARVLVGRKVGYLSSTSTDTATTQTVEFLDTGTQLYFRPFVSNEGVIRMELKPQVSEAVIRQANDASGKDVTIPDEITNELVTNVMVHDGQTIVLGGLFRESTQSTRRQVPLLGDIPIIGYAFRGNEDNTQRNEIIFLVTPSIVNDETVASQGERGKQYVDHLRVGAREGVLFWSRDKLSNRRNLKAERAFEAGDTDSALWNVERSLCLNHNQPEIIAMREKLTGEKNLWPTRSFMDRVVHGDHEQLLNKGKASSMAVPGTPSAESPDNMSTVTSNLNTTYPSTSPSYNKFEDPSEDDGAATAKSPATPNTTPNTHGARTTPSNPETPASTTPGSNPETPSNPADNDGMDESPKAPGNGGVNSEWNGSGTTGGTAPSETFNPTDGGAGQASGAVGQNSGWQSGQAGTVRGVVQNKTVADASGKQFSGRHTFMQGMWMYFRHMAAAQGTVAQVNDATTPESTDK